MGDCLLYLLHSVPLAVRSGKGCIAEGSGSTFRLRSRLTNRAFMQKGKAKKGMVSSIKNVSYAKAIAIYPFFPSLTPQEDEMMRSQIIIKIKLSSSLKLTHWAQ
jgi:hypothetical protein